jgi:hypothetical protein
MILLDCMEEMNERTHTALNDCFDKDDDASVEHYGVIQVL